jgi:glycosyltransferase involved in cell wall biosynthesis
MSFGCLLTRVACIPAYNEERTIAMVVIECQAFVDRVIVCDDGSQDMTSDIASRLGAEVIRHDRNMGKGQALRSLFLAVRKLGCDMMITVDADAQHDPKEIPKLLAPLESGEADIVIGSRFLESKGSVPQHRLVVNKLFNLMTLDGISDTQSGFRAYGKKAIQRILPAEAGMGVDSEILMDAASDGLRIVEVPITVSYGVGKTSKLNPVHHSLDVIFSIVKLTSIRHPLIFYGSPGAALVVVGLYYFYRTVTLFSSQQQITTLTLTYGLIAFSVTIFGLLALFTGVILFTISSVVRKSQE